MQLRPSPSRTAAEARLPQGRAKASLLLLTLCRLGAVRGQALPPGVYPPNMGLKPPPPSPPLPPPPLPPSSYIVHDVTFQGAPAVSPDPGVQLAASISRMLAASASAYGSGVEAGSESAAEDNIGSGIDLAPHVPGSTLLALSSSVGNAKAQFSSLGHLHDAPHTGMTDAAVQRRCVFHLVLLAVIVTLLLSIALYQLVFCRPRAPPATRSGQRGPSHSTARNKRCSTCRSEATHLRGLSSSIACILDDSMAGEKQARARNAGALLAPIRLVLLLSWLVSLPAFHGGEKFARRGLSTLNLQPSGILQYQGTSPVYSRNVRGKHNNDFFGDTAILSGDGYRVACGARMAMGSPGEYFGIVEVYAYDSGSWVQMGDSLYGDSATGRIGTAVALSFDGSRVAIGVPGGNSDNGLSTGYVQVWDWDGGSWNEFAHIMDGPGKANEEDFGAQIAMQPNGQRLVIGSQKYDFSTSITGSGLVRVYEVDATGTSWVRVGDDYDGEPGLRQALDELGSSVAISYDGTRIAAGALQSYDYRGSTRALVQPSDANPSWSLVGDILYSPSDLSGSSDGYLCGIASSFAANGNIMSTGCKQAAGNAGQVRVFEYSGGAWSPRGQYLDGDVLYDRAFAHALSAGGQYIIIGAYGADTNGKLGNGQVRIYQYDASGTWVMISEDDGPTPTINSRRYGWSVSISADASRIAIGAPGSSVYGTVYIFETGIVDCNEDPSPPPPPPAVPPPPLRPLPVLTECSCVAHSPTAPNKICTASGDPHYINFDGLAFDYFARGLYEHARFRIASCGCEVVVQTLLVKLIGGPRSSRSNSAIAAIATRVGNDTFTFTTTGGVTIRSATLDIQLNGTSDASRSTYGGCILERFNITENRGAWRLILPGSWGVLTTYPAWVGGSMPEGFMYATWLAVSDNSTVITGMNGICSAR